MKQGNILQIVHSMHTIIIFFATTLTVIFIPIFGIDDLDKIVLLHSGTYTFIGSFYNYSLMICIFFFGILGAFHSIPYLLVFWIQAWRKIVNVKIHRAIWISILSISFWVPILYLVINIFFRFYSNGEYFLPFLLFLLPIIDLISVYCIPYIIIKEITPLSNIYKYIVISQITGYIVLLIYIKSPLFKTIVEYGTSHLLKYNY